MANATLPISSMVHLGLGLGGRACELLTVHNTERTLYLFFIGYILLFQTPSSRVISRDHYNLLLLLLVSNENFGRHLGKLIEGDLEISFLMVNIITLLLLHPLGTALLRNSIMLQHFFFNYSTEQERKLEMQLRLAFRQAQRIRFEEMPNE